MRTLLIALFLVIFFIISIPLYIILLIVGLFDLNLRDIHSQKIVTITCKIILFLSGTKLTVLGQENIPEEGGVLFAFNHRSYFDILVSYASTTKLSTFVAKQELKYFPFINIWMIFINCLFIDRDDIRQSMKVILKAIEMVKDGYSIFISPEGTRNSGEKLMPFKDGSFKIAQKSACPIIPVAINNADSIFEKQIPIVKRAHVIVEYCQPVYYDQIVNEGHKNVGKYVQNIVQQTVDKNEAILEF